MSRSRELTERVLRCIERLSERIDSEAMLPCADAPHLVAVVGAFSSMAGRLERRVEERPWWFDSAANAAHEVRMLRSTVRAHSLMRRLRAIKAGKR